MRIKPIIIISVIFFCNFSSPDFLRAVNHQIQKLSFKLVGEEPENKYEAQVENYLLSLVYPISRYDPSVWDSPLIITDKSTGNLYQTESLLITDVYYVQKHKMLIVESYGGSLSYVHFFDIKTGKKNIKQSKYIQKK